MKLYQPKRKMRTQSSQHQSLKIPYNIFRENKATVFIQSTIGIAYVKNHCGEGIINTTTHISSQKVISISKLHWAEFPANKCDNIELYES